MGVARVEYVLPLQATDLDHRRVPFRMNGVHPIQRRRFGPRVGKLPPQGCAEQMLDQELKSLRALGVAGSGVMLQVVWVIDESNRIHRRVCDKDGYILDGLRELKTRLSSV
jgi:hypothetical protein